MCPRTTCFQDLHPVLHLQGTEGQRPCRNGGMDTDATHAHIQGSHWYTISG